MAAFLANEVWQELKRYVNTVDRADAAETVVSVLIDNDISVEEIRDAFKGDTEIKRALTQYLDDHAANDDEDEYEDEDDWGSDEDEDY
jgi:hypothetical protein